MVFLKCIRASCKEGCGAVVLLYYPETGDEISKNIQTILDPNAHTSQAPERCGLSPDWNQVTNFNGSRNSKDEANECPI